MAGHKVTCGIDKTIFLTHFSSYLNQKFRNLKKYEGIEFKLCIRADVLGVYFDIRAYNTTEG